MPRYQNLPLDLQQKESTYMCSERRRMKQFSGDVTDNWYSPRAALRSPVRGVDFQAFSKPFEPPISGFPSGLL